MKYKDLFVYGRGCYSTNPEYPWDHEYVTNIKDNLYIVINISNFWSESARKRGHITIILDKNLREVKFNPVEY